MWPALRLKLLPRWRPMTESTIEMRSVDDPMKRARHIFMAMAMPIRADEIGELMLRRAADVLTIYRDLDRASPPAKGPPLRPNHHLNRGPANYKRQPAEPLDWFFVQCNDAECGATTQGWGLRSSARKAWNRRAEEARHDGVLVEHNEKLMTLAEARKEPEDK